MDNNDNIPRLVWERDQIRASHTIRMLILLTIFLVVVIVVIVGAFLFHLREKDKEWLNFLEQYDFETYDYQQDGGGVNIIGDSNGVDYNGAETSSTQNDAQERESER